MRCYKCGEPGHVKAECPHPSPGITITEEMTCFICGQPGHVAIACRLHPSRLRSIRGEACGDGPCTSSCRCGDHQDCAFGWCTCICHPLFQAIAQR